MESSLGTAAQVVKCWLGFKYAHELGGGPGPRTIGHGKTWPSVAKSSGCPRASSVVQVHISGRSGPEAAVHLWSTPNCQLLLTLGGIVRGGQQYLADMGAELFAVCRIQEIWHVGNRPSRVQPRKLRYP